MGLGVAGTAAAIGAAGTIGGAAISSSKSGGGSTDAEAQAIQNSKIQASAQENAGDLLGVGSVNATNAETQATLQAQQYLQQYNQTAQGQISGANTAAQAAYQNAYGQASGILNPFIQGGQQAYGQLVNALPSLTAPMNMTQQQLEQTPGYQFQLSQGLEANQNQASARGLGISGAAMKGADAYTTGLASSTYQTQLQNYLAQNQQAYGILSGTAGIGAGAGQTLAGIGSSLGQSEGASALETGLAGATATQNTGAGLGSLQASYGSAVGQNIMNAAQAAAGASTGAANATAQGGNTAATIGLQNAQNQGAIQGGALTGLGSSIGSYLQSIGNGTNPNPFGGSSSGEFNSSNNGWGGSTGGGSNSGLLNNTGTTSDGWLDT